MFGWLSILTGATAASGHRPLQVLVDRRQELLCGLPSLLGPDQQRQVLRHLTAFDGLDAYTLERLGEGAHLRRAVHPPARREAARPGEDRSDRGGRGGLALPGRRAV